MPDDVEARSHYAVLVVSVWFEEPGETGFRARVSVVAPDGSSEIRGTTARSDEVTRLVSSWLDEIHSTRD